MFQNLHTVGLRRATHLQDRALAALAAANGPRLKVHTAVSALSGLARCPLPIQHSPGPASYRSGELYQWACMCHCQEWKPTEASFRSFCNSAVLVAV